MRTSLYEGHISGVRIELNTMQNALLDNQDRSVEVKQVMIKQSALYYVKSPRGTVLRESRQNKRTALCAKLP